MSLDIEAGLRRPKIDMHCHVWQMPSDADAVISSKQLIKAGEMLGITEYWCSSPLTDGILASIEEVRVENDRVLAAARHFPNQIRGMCFVIAGHFQDALDEINRCLDAGMVGIKLYNQYRINDPAVVPVIELAIDRRVPILEHAGKPPPEGMVRQPLISWGTHFAEVNERYPEAMLIHAHIVGGGDWEYTVRAMRDASPNLYCDISGSNLDDGAIEFAVSEMGAERILFGTDGTMAGSVGKVLDASITDEEKDLIFWGNAERILAAQGRKPTQPRTGEVTQ
jgi:predicted TIM-barrel fold metal-dependent hydrolase